MATYAFILGRKHILSTAEILNCVDPSVKIVDILPESCLISFKKSLENPNLSLDKLGGTIKIVEILSELSIADGSKNELITDLISECIVKNHQEHPVKLNFAVSLYSFTEKHEQILKKILTGTKKSCP